jgi:hypothetical protein
MIADIEQAIISMLKARWALLGNGSALNEFDINLDFNDVLNTPAVAVATEKFGTAFSTDETIKIEPVISLYHVFKNVGKPDQRRLGIYPIVTGCMQILSGQDFGLGIDPLRAAGGNEVYHEKLKMMGLIGYKCDYHTSFNLDPFDPESADDVALLSEGLNYYCNSIQVALDAISYPEE